MSYFQTGTLSDLKKQYESENSNSKQIFLKALQHFLDVKSGSDSSATVSSEVPFIGAKYLDLYSFYHMVDRRQGFDHITQTGKWRLIATELGLSEQQVPDENVVKDWYSKFLLSFANAIKRRTSAQSGAPAPGAPMSMGMSMKRPLPQSNPLSSGDSSSQLRQPPPVTNAPDPLDATGNPLIKRPRTAQTGGAAPVFHQPPSHQRLQQQPMANPASTSSFKISQPMPKSVTTPSQNHQNTSQQSGNASSALQAPSASTGPLSQTANLKSIISRAQIEAAISNIKSSDINQVYSGLNYLMQASMEADNPLQARNTVFIEKYPSLLTALGDLLDICNPFTRILFSLTNKPSEVHGCHTSACSGINLDPMQLALASLEVQKAVLWRERNPLDEDNVLRSMARSLDSNAVLISTLAIVRNLSFEITNMQIMSCSASIVQHLVALIMVAACPAATAPPVVYAHMSRIRNSSLMQATSYAIDAMYHIGRYVDVTGKKRLSACSEDPWLKNSLHFDGLERESLKLFLSEHMSAQSTERYITATSHLLPALLRCITKSPERDIVRRCLGVLCKVASVEENASTIAMFCPDEYLSALIGLLCTSVTTAEVLSSVPVGDSLAGPDPAVASKWDKLPACAGDFNDFADVEIRDMTLEALRALCSFPDSGASAATWTNPTESPEVSMKTRLASTPGCLRILSNIVTTASNGVKTDGFSRAVALLSYLAENMKNYSRMMLMESDLCIRALSDEDVAEAIVMTALKGPFVETTTVIAVGDATPIIPEGSVAVPFV